MSKPKLISPLLDGFLIGDPISNHHGVQCCPAMRRDTDEKYIVKIISIPASQVQLEALLLTGAYKTKDGALAYFKELSEGVEQEAEVLKRLSKLEGFDAYESWQVVPMEDGVGYHVYLLSPYKRSLERVFRHRPMTHLGAVNLGLDMCAALSVCRRAGYLYADLKPGNIFITDDHVYHIGDLGFMSLASLKYASLPDKYRSCWTAPEIVDAFASLNQTIDIYALGLILYQAYNNGQLPFEGAAPADMLPAPMYADYEMAEIILKACAPDPKDRWQDPLQMGQALVSYMQRNSINDTPIVPPPAPVEEPVSEKDTADAEIIPGEEVPEEPISAEVVIETDDASQDEQIQVSIDDILDDPQMILNEELDAAVAAALEDETLPSEAIATELTEDGLTEEVSQMLAQADDLIAHETPLPVVAPEPIDVPVPPPLPKEEPEPETDSVSETVPVPVEDAPEEVVEEALPALEEIIEAEDEVYDEPEIYERTPSKPKRKARFILTPIIAILLLLALAAGGLWYYQNRYLQNISGLTYETEMDKLTVNITTDIDESKLTVLCADTYGNTKRSNVVNGVAKFDGLAPGTDYKITVEISGFHQLTGAFTGSVTTDAQTNIVTFTAIAGSEDGSVILNFTVDGSEPQEWKVQYSADGEPDQEISFTGHMVTVAGLIPGKEYTFKLVPQSDLLLVGNSEVKFTATKVIYAENLSLVSYANSALTVDWNAPEGAVVNSWNVRCYNEYGYDESITVYEPSATFQVADSTVAYTIEVTAEGMTPSVKTYIGANPININAINCDTLLGDSILVQWDYDGAAPEGGWLLLYTIDGNPMQSVVKCEENYGVISPMIPGSKYTITVQAANGSVVFGGNHELVIPWKAAFSGFPVTSADMEFYMCKTPAKANWKYDELDLADYTTYFAAGENASFVIHATKGCGTRNDPVSIMFIIRDGAGNFVSIAHSSGIWNDMWEYRYCELDIPAIPAVAGEYTVEIYFNDGFLYSQAFTVY